MRLEPGSILIDGYSGTSGPTSSFTSFEKSLTRLSLVSRKQSVCSSQYQIAHWNDAIRGSKRFFPPLGMVLFLVLRPRKLAPKDLIHPAPSREPSNRSSYEKAACLGAKVQTERMRARNLDALQHFLCFQYKMELKMSPKLNLCQGAALEHFSLRS